MHRLATLAAALVPVLVAAGCGGDDEDAGNSPPEAVDAGDDGTHDTDRAADDADAGALDARALAGPVAEMRRATTKYLTDVAAAQADGFAVITPMMPDMGVHYLDADVTGFDPAAPPILVYLPTDDGPQLGAVEWVFPEVPEEPPLPGAEYGEFAAACHYADGTFAPEPDEAACPRQSPESGAAFGFWHPDLVTLHVWVWHPNPAGLFAGTNPLVTPYNDTAPPTTYPVT